MMRGTSQQERSVNHTKAWTRLACLLEVVPSDPDVFKFYLRQTSIEVLLLECHTAPPSTYFARK